MKYLEDHLKVVKHGVEVGDLVQHFGDKNHYGVVIETGVYTGRKNTLVMWKNGDIFTCTHKNLEVMNDSV